MKLSEYLSPDRFPTTTQPGMSAIEQLMIDAFNHDALQEHLDEGGRLDAEQGDRWTELLEKRPHAGRLTRESRYRHT